MGIPPRKTGKSCQVEPGIAISSATAAEKNAWSAATGCQSTRTVRLPKGAAFHCGALVGPCVSHAPTIRRKPRHQPTSAMSPASSERHFRRIASKRPTVDWHCRVIDFAGEATRSRDRVRKAEPPSVAKASTLPRTRGRRLRVSIRLSRTTGSSMEKLSGSILRLDRVREDSPAQVDPEAGWLPMSRNCPNRARGDRGRQKLPATGQ